MIPLLVATVMIAQDAPAVAPVKLARTYAAGESQAYTAMVTLKTGAIEDTVKIQGEFVLTVKSVTGELAKVEMATKSVKMFLGEQELPGDDLPKPTAADYTTAGIPKAVTPEDEENPLSFVFPAFCLPVKSVEIGKDFDMSWACSDGRMKISGKGTLVATGMLYEEHVSKLSVKVDVVPKDDPPAVYEYTAYFNTQTGKLVKAEGKVSSESEELGGKFSADFVVAKVRAKASAWSAPGARNKSWN